MLDRNKVPPVLTMDPPADGWTWTAFSHVLQLARDSEHDPESLLVYDQLAHAVLDEDLNPRAGRP